MQPVMGRLGIETPGAGRSGIDIRSGGASEKEVAMEETLRAFGRGIIKVLISLFVGAGAGLMTFGIGLMRNPAMWNQREPPGEMFLGIGVGCLTAGVMLLVLFIFMGRRKPPSFPDRGETGVFEARQ